MLSAFTVLGVIIYIVMSLCSKCHKKAAEKKRIQSMHSFNTIEVAQMSSAAHSAQHSSAGLGEQHGLMGASSNVKDDFFDDDKEKINSRKMKITDAIEDADAGKKKTVLKKKKKKGGKK